MEVSGGPGAAGTLDSKTYDFDTMRTWNAAAGSNKTSHDVADMSLATGPQVFEGPGTTRFETNMSVVEEESDSTRSKTTNLQAPMDEVFEGDEEEEEAEEAGGQTVRLGTDMELATGPLAGPRTVRLDEPMEMEESDAEAGEDLNQGFTKDWAGARTVNFGATMDLVAEEDEQEEHEQAQAQEEAQEAVPEQQQQQVSDLEEEDEENLSLAQWNLNATQHTAAADAVRKSLELGGRPSLGRRSVDRLSGAERLSLGRSPPHRDSLSNRESLNRSSLLSPVEESAEHEEEPSPFARPQPLVLPAAAIAAPVAPAAAPVKKALPVPPHSKEAPAKPRATAAAAVVEHPPVGGRVMVAHPIAGVQVAVPQSRLPALFDRRYSTRRIIRNFGRDDAEEAAEAVAPEEEEVAVHESFAAEPARKRRAAEEASQDERASMRQSFAPGELPVAEFLWMANVRFAEEQPVLPLPPSASASASVSTAPSLCSTEVAALEREMELLLAEAESLRAAIEREEEALLRGSNPLFAAVQTSEQHVLEAVQTQLAEFKRLCLLQAETAALSHAVQLSAAARASFRQVGERAVRDARAVYQLTGQMHGEREALRGARAAALARAAGLREEQQRREQRSAAAAAGSRLLASVFETVTHCAVLAQGPGRAELLVCGAARLLVTEAAVECVLAEGLSAWRANLVRATGTLGTVARAPGASLQQAVEPVRARLLRCNAGACELRSVARRFTVIYTDDAADVYFSSKTAMAILHVRRSSAMRDSFVSHSAFV